jgi:hypothetical protein
MVVAVMEVVVVMVVTMEVEEDVAVVVWRWF